MEISQKIHQFPGGINLYPSKSISICIEKSSWTFSTGACKNMSDIFLHFKLCNRDLHDFIHKIKNRLLMTKMKDMNIHIKFLNKKINDSVTELSIIISTRRKKSSDYRGVNSPQ